MARIYRDPDADLQLFDHKIVAIMGFGRQGRAHALNLRDSGVRVIVGLRPASPRWQRADAAGFFVLPIAEAARYADIVMSLVPEASQGAIFARQIAPHLQEGDTLMITRHPYDGERVPEGVHVARVSPQAHGDELRQRFLDGSGAAAAVTIERDPSGQALGVALAYAKALGCTRAGVVEIAVGEAAESACSAVVSAGKACIPPQTPTRPTEVVDWHESFTMGIP